MQEFGVSDPVVPELDSVGWSFVHSWTLSTKRPGSQVETNRLKFFLSREIEYVGQSLDRRVMILRRTFHVEAWNLYDHTQTKLRTRRCSLLVVQSRGQKD